MKCPFNIAILYYCFLFLINTNAFGQELPPIQKFTPAEYKGENQNWMFSQASNHFIYTANNDGLLEFNGAEWTLYPSPNNTIIRAVNVIGDKIYTGCYADFGFWRKDKFNTLTYTSLTNKLGATTFKDDQVWNIIEYNEWVVFQTSKQLYFYNTNSETFKTISSTRNIYKIFKVRNKIYYHVANEGLYVVKNGKPKLIATDSILKTERVISIFENHQNLGIITRSSGFFTLTNQELTSWTISADSLLNNVDIFSSIQLKDGSFMLGTISDGVIHLNANGDLNYQINQKKGLTNNTVLSLFEDKANHVWAGLDNGINCINVKSPVKTFIDYEGVLGTVYTTRIFKNNLYIGTNQGLFYRKLNDANATFKFIEGTAGQVWELYVLNNQYLFCGHHFGAFLIQSDKAEKISDTLGAWAFKPIPNHSDLLLQGNYSGFLILKNINGNWQVRNKITGFENSSRYFEINNQNQVWVNHEYKGVFKLKLNDSLTKVIKLDTEKTLPFGENSSLISYKNNMFYTSENGMYRYTKTDKTFEKDTLLSNYITKTNQLDVRVTTDNTGKLWMFSENNMSYIKNDEVINQPIINSIPIPTQLRKGVSGFENISFLAPSTYILGTVNGYITLDLNKIHIKKENTIHLNSVTLKTIEDKLAPQILDSKGEFKYKYGMITFKYATPEYEKYLDVKYQYILEGQANKWSKWTTQPQVTFENLTFGNYTFKVRAKIGNNLSKNTATYSFTVNRPWYFTNTAIALYCLLLLVVIFITHKVYKRHYIKKFEKEQLESEQLIMQMKNEKLNQDIEARNRELAISTMSLIKKSEVLNSIKKELKKELKKDKKIENSNSIKLINDNLNDSKDWSFFEQAFNNADKDFLDKIKAIHPDLTPNDLRFCAYLRLNLSSKEMAPLLNISLRSVETKRYRLRKKMNLEQDDSLVNYILNF
ncbi:helix-turn-helix and ligand-binding sensor domain-containing protein [Formosa sp. 3Alg 14/1]|uniref:helix-turn-helix and ligand-binding sensor domain-containing protein n=1 Tax=Formosa sp. 3Alg 14/1 TaxID=3382190 RepID=UPI0039BE6428